MIKDVVLLSGGLDSTAALAAMEARGSAARAVTIDYGQPTREIESAQRVARRYSIPVHVLGFRPWTANLGPTTVTTITPNRNAVLIMTAASIAQTWGCHRVVIGVHAGDHPFCSDARPDFIAAARSTIGFATDGKVGLYAPFVNDTKADVARLAYDLAAPIGLTWSCVDDGEFHCGGCGPCRERHHAFTLAGREDPTVYAGDITGEPHPVRADT